MNIYIVTCDKYCHLMPGFCYLFNRFWDSEQKVTVLYYNKIESLPHNFQCLSLGTNDSVQNWSGPLRKFFSGVKEEYFIFGVEDCWLLSEVNKNLLNHLIEKFIKQNVAKIGLTLDILKFGGTKIDTIEGVNIFESDQTARYRTSLQIAIWRKDYLLKYLQPNLTPWQFEIRGNKLAKNDDARIIGADCGVLNYNTLYVKGRINKEAVLQLKEYNLFETLKKKNYL